ncbi:ABC transporter ATP-binding protein [Maridesulfovibrio ferrireducens]|uniref:Lipoprotein-releasing system ATP-binding protein n=1 Tax=Maridesulfovibrio ferrireducens TaxID=246191 RepID=A0A1G9HD95_9BACT|nr:ABC transporter ATP-binding protein [Maridesulfovibrio ferrireducens]MBI9110558.1 ABC transporter ATP-binding protein [Maridesulfovibrio ferrireducens]SDL10815.1 lipoprotein-releasing system ATP-binding protein [Maridesulfovibrio ferrireducens]
MSSLLYELTGIGKEFEGPTEIVQVLNNINLNVESGESLAIMGSSGSGKTTLLHILGTLDTASRGNIDFAGMNFNDMPAEKRAQVRNREIGFIFQFHHLLPEFTTLENVALPAMVAGISQKKASAMAREALVLVGLENRLDHRVTTLSGGERQRAAIARAVLLKPKVLLADEPTGNLDEKTGKMVGEMLVSLNEELGMTLIVVTHNIELAGIMKRRLELRSGELYAQN